jgi:RHS repeat-associated protein
VPVGRTRELAFYEIQYADSLDYLLGGSLMLKNGRIDKSLFDGGYTHAIQTSATTDRFVFYYYNKDHLGNNRELETASGLMHQVTNYYPFGAPYADPDAVMSANRQQYKYNGKELDILHGLNTYDYGARQYYSILGRWDRIDPLCEKYYSLSPYNYCGNNPIRFIDPDGMRIYVEEDSREQVLEWINALSKDQYKIDDSGFLFLAGSTSEKYHSQYYSDRLNAAIDNDNIINIHIRDNYGGYNISERGGGLTLISGNDNADVVLTGHTNYSLHDVEGGSLYCGPEYILAHELVGHAIPYTTPSIYNDNRDTGYAIDSENIVRSETNSKLRAIDEYSRTDISFPLSQGYDIPWKGNRTHKRTMQIRSFNSLMQNNFNKIRK